MDLTDCPQLVIEKFRARKINPLAAHFRSSDSAYLDALRSAVEKAGWHIVDLGIGAGDFYSLDLMVQQQAFAYGSKWVDIASHIGSPSERQHLRARQGGKPDAALLAQGLVRLVDYGTKRNIVINLENDDRISEDPFVIVSVIEKERRTWWKQV